MSDNYEIPVSGMSVTRPITPEQRKNFGLALCERLGLDPKIVNERIDWYVAGDEEFGKIALTVYLPAQEILDLWNGAAP